MPISKEPHKIGEGLNSYSRQGEPKCIIALKIVVGRNEQDSERCEEKQMSDDTPKAKRGRPRKKPGYDRTEQIDVLLEKAVDLFGEPFDDRKERSKDAPSIRDVANAMDATPLKIRKILITTGHYSTELSRKVQSLPRSHPPGG